MRDCSVCKRRESAEPAEPQGFWEAKVCSRVGVRPFVCRECGGRFFGFAKKAENPTPPLSDSSTAVSADPQESFSVFLPSKDGQEFTDVVEGIRHSEESLSQETNSPPGSDSVPSDDPIRSIQEAERAAARPTSPQTGAAITDLADEEDDREGTISSESSPPSVDLEPQSGPESNDERIELYRNPQGTGRLESDLDAAVGRLIRLSPPAVLESVIRFAHQRLSDPVFHPEPEAPIETSAVRLDESSRPLEVEPDEPPERISSPPQASAPKEIVTFNPTAPFIPTGKEKAEEDDMPELRLDSD